MNRRHFIQSSGLATGALILPQWSRAAAELATKEPLAVAKKKLLADAALNAATKAGASYADVRIGRYLNQSISTREQKVQGVGSTESYGAGVRVIANGAWGFMSVDQLTPETVARAAREAVAIAKANARLQTEPVRLAPQKGVGEVAWRTPIKKNGFQVPLADKVERLLATNAAAQKAGATFVNSQLSLVNEQKYFASTDGSSIDQDIHRIYPNFMVTVTDAKTGRFQTRRSLSAPIGLGYEYLDADPAGKIPGADGGIPQGSSVQRLCRQRPAAACAGRTHERPRRLSFT